MSSFSNRINTLFRLTLPKRQENHRFDCTELQDGFERRQKIPGGKIKQEQSIKGKRHGNVINNGDVNVASVWTPVSVAVMSERLQEYNHESHQGFNETKLQSRLFTEPEETDRVRFAVQTTGTIQATRTDRFAADF